MRSKTDTVARTCLPDFCCRFSSARKRSLPLLWLDAIKDNVCFADPRLTVRDSKRQLRRDDCSPPVNSTIVPLWDEVSSSAWRDVRLQHSLRSLDIKHLWTILGVFVQHVIPAKDIVCKLYFKFLIWISSLCYRHTKQNIREILLPKTTSIFIFWPSKLCKFKICCINLLNKGVVWHVWKRSSHHLL